MENTTIPWSTFLSRSSPSAVVGKLTSVFNLHFQNQDTLQRRRQKKKTNNNSSANKSSTNNKSRNSTKRRSLLSRMFGSDNKPIQTIKPSIIEDLCLTVIDVIGKRQLIKYNSQPERIEAQFAFITLITSLAQYSRSSSFDARNSLSGIHLPKSTHVALYDTIITLLKRPEFDFRLVTHTERSLKGSSAHVAGEYWRVLLVILQLVLDLVFWAREEEMQFAAQFFAMAIFRLPSVGGHVIDSLNQFHSRAAAHYRRLYPASTRSSEVEYSLRRRHRINRSGSLTKSATSATSTTVAVDKQQTKELKEKEHKEDKKEENKEEKKEEQEKLIETESSTIPPAPTTTSLTPPSSPYAKQQREKKLLGRNPRSSLSSPYTRARSSSQQSFDFINANPVIFGWLTFQSKVQSIDSSSVVNIMKKRKKEWNGRLRSSREFGMMLASAVVDHVQDVVSSHGNIWWEEVPLYPVLADMVLLTLRRQFHLLVHPTDPSAIDDYEIRSALRKSKKYKYDGNRNQNKNQNKNQKNHSALPPFRSNETKNDTGDGSGNESNDSNDSNDSNESIVTVTEEQEGNLIFSRSFFDTIVSTCSHFFSADPIMRSALLRMVCRHMDAERVSSVGPCLGAIELWLLRLHRVSPISMTVAMQLPCMRSAISSLLKSSRFVCTCRGLTFITTVVQHLSDAGDDEALVWFLRDILFDHFFDLMLSWSSFIRRFFHDFLVYRVFKLKRSLLDLPSDRRLFEMFPGENEDHRVHAYDKARNEFSNNRSNKRFGKKRQAMNGSGAGSIINGGGAGLFLPRSLIERATRSSATNVPQQRPDAATLSPSDMALATKMEAYMRILLAAVNDPSSFDDKCCKNSDQRRGYIKASLEQFSDQLYIYYVECGDSEPGYFEGEPPEMEMSIDALMRKFAE